MARKPNTSRQTRALLAALLARPQTWRHGYDLSKATGLRSGTLYPSLMRLSEQGLLESRWQETERPGLPPRHVYRLTAAGLALARDQERAAIAAECKEGLAKGGLAKGGLAKGGLAKGGLAKGMKGRLGMKGFGMKALPTRRQAAARLARHAAAVLPAAQSPWARAMRHELDYIEDDRLALRWALGCVLASYKARLVARPRARTRTVLRHAAASGILMLVVGVALLENAGGQTPPAPPVLDETVCDGADKAPEIVQAPPPRGAVRAVPDAGRPALETSCQVLILRRAAGHDPRSSERRDTETPDAVTSDPWRGESR
jgi:PadR family transcriptional regulator, regulatory protein PadR